MIMAGGTGGHVMPALAVAEQLRERGIDVVWLGSRRGLETRLVPQAGYRLLQIRVAGLRQAGALDRLLAPLRLLRALGEALRLMLRERPAAVLGLGGFAAGPGGVAAWLLRRPLCLHEQNARPGLTNRLLAPLARRVLTGFPDVPLGRAPQWVGNPVRAAIAALAPPPARWQDRSGPLRLLVLGGSQGAQALNDAVCAFAASPAAAGVAIRHQCGERNLAAVEAAYAERELANPQTHDGAGVRVDAFIDDMAAAYAWADLVLCRAGALTVAELCAAGVGALLVPYPHAADDHQTVNAQVMVTAGAGRLIAQPELDAGRIAAELAATGRERALEMACAARGLARPQAAQQVCEALLELARA